MPSLSYATRYGHTAAERMRHRLRQPLARTPYLYDVAIMLRSSKREVLARHDSALVIEGFLRSGNTYSVAAFRLSNGFDLHIGRHLHAAAHVHRAVRLGVPTVVLIREPADAVLSYLVRRPKLSVNDALREYIDFYRSIGRVRDRFVVAPFERVITDFGSVIETVNERFGTNFTLYEHTPENEAACLRLVEAMNREECGGQLVETHVARPSEARTAGKEALAAGLRTSRNARLLDAARSLHRSYVG